jgi:hypothetical protein
MLYRAADVGAIEWQILGAQGMDADWPMDAARVPPGLPPDRAWRWCLLRTRRDIRLAARHGRAISPPNARRLLQRRWRMAEKLFSATH